jgi:hypothetical protein
MVGFNTFFNKECPVSFVVRNNVANKIVRVFRYPIYPGTSRDLMSINYVSEADIKNSLLKGELHIKLKTGELSIESSNIDLSTIDSCHQQFLREHGLTVGLDSISSSSVANLTELAALSPSEGSLVFVQTLRDYFSFSATSTLTADSITVVDSTVTTGKWERKKLASDMWAYQSTWYINATTGNDENNGLTSGTALKTHAELQRRLQNAEIKQNTTVNILTDLNEEINLKCT